MNSSQDLVIVKRDFDKLTGLVNSVTSETSELLEDELNRALIVDAADFPQNTVSMNSIVTFLDKAQNKELTLELVYPNETEVTGKHKKVSILAPIGAALIGLKAGQSINWPLASGQSKELNVLSVKSA